MDVLELIKQQVESNPVVIYMKGTPEMPRCGFSQRATQALAATGEKGKAEKAKKEAIARGTNAGGHHKSTDKRQYSEAWDQVHGVFGLWEFEGWNAPRLGKFHKSSKIRRDA